MVNLTIDNIPVSVKENTTIMEAAAKIDINIPKLCFLKDLNEIAACRVCVVELKGKDKLITSCNNVCEEGMEIFTNSKKVIRDRRKTVELILSQHDNRCVICAKSGNCSLQKVANDLNILEIPFAVELEKQPWNKNFPLIRDSSKCIKCMRCIQVCDKMQTLSVWDLHGTGARTTVNVTGYKKIEEADCSLCGQCITHCPVGALSERDDTSKFWEAVADPEKTVVVQIAPAVRTAWGEVFGLKDKDATVGKIVDALKKMGADYVFDTSFSADLTIMEEANEFVHRYTNGLIGDRPMFTSCCPGWVRFVKSQYPRMTKSLSTAKSPQQMFGAVMKSYFAEKIGVKPENMVSVSIMPCVAKKGEREMELFHGEYAGHDVDIALTTRELTRMIRASHINPKSLEDVVADRPMGDYSGAGVIFGTTGGVMEAALRTAYSIIKKENPPADVFKPVRSKTFQENDGTVEAKFNIDDIELNIAVVSGLGNTRKLLNKIERGEAKYDFVEVMACPGGCVGGGGQPVKDGYELAFDRGKKLYFLDENSEIRYSHENKDIIALYDEYFHKPLSHKAHALLHVQE
ncbi:MAG: [FeFe] hydrogenase, group A [Lachnoanaerobaculum sp.]|nr:[FeFe] hydrogenase, group A [Lachnoanaerobaculum sp.]